MPLPGAEWSLWGGGTSQGWILWEDHGYLYWEQCCGRGQDPDASDDGFWEDMPTSYKDSPVDGTLSCTPKQREDWIFLCEMCQGRNGWGFSDRGVCFCQWGYGCTVQWDGGHTGTRRNSIRKKTSYCSEWRDGSESAYRTSGGQFWGYHCDEWSRGDEASVWELQNPFCNSSWYECAGMRWISVSGADPWWCDADLCACDHHNRK